MNKKLMDLLGKLINLQIDYVELSCFGVEDPERGKICQICGFPFDKKYREKCVIQTHDQIMELWIECLPKRESFHTSFNGGYTHGTDLHNAQLEAFHHGMDTVFNVLDQAQNKEG